jgi:hypothetical protein
MLEAVNPSSLLRPERLEKLKKFNELIGNQTRDLLVCCIVALPTMLPLAAVYFVSIDNVLVLLCFVTCTDGN